MILSISPWIIWPTVLFSTLTALSLYLYITWNYGYWKKRGVPHDKPTFPFGNVWDIMAQRKSVYEFYKDIYNRFKGHRFAGILMMKDPTLLVQDPDLIKRLFIKDFSHFHDRGIAIDEENDPISGHLFNLPGSRWHALRNKLSPTFTSGKMKYMFAAVKACSQHLQNTTANEVKKYGANVEMKELMSRFTTDVIGSVAFGVEAGSLENPEAEFRVIGRRLFASTFANAIRSTLVLFAPELSLKLGIQSADPVATKYFMKVVKETVEYRDQNNVSRADFLQLLLNMRDKDEDANSETGLTMNQLTAQCFVFYIGGFETSATTLSFCLYELARNLDLQQQVREEVENVLAEHGGEMTYDAVGKLHLTERVVAETLRKYPALPILFRECTKGYVIPDCDASEADKWTPETRKGGLLIEQGIKVHIPIVGLHYDPDYFPDPERFDPDRFTEEGKKTWPPFAYLPFGEGPRICIGMRFGNIQTKCGLAALLSKFEFRPSPKTPYPLKFDQANFVPTVKDGLWLQIVERHSD